MLGVVPALVDKDGKEIEVCWATALSLFPVAAFLLCLDATDGSPRIVRPCPHPPSRLLCFSPLQGAGEGYLVIKKPWPGQMRTVYGDHDRFEMTYFSQFDGYYCTGDGGSPGALCAQTCALDERCSRAACHLTPPLTGARRDEHGYYWITGRVDDVINVRPGAAGTRREAVGKRLRVACLLAASSRDPLPLFPSPPLSCSPLSSLNLQVSGHRIGTAELEGAMAHHPDVVEAAIVAIPHAIKGEGIYVFVTCRPGVTFDDAKAKEFKVHIRSAIGAFAQPDVIQNATGLPKTRSGTSPIMGSGRGGASDMGKRRRVWQRARQRGKQRVGQSKEATHLRNAMSQRSAGKVQRGIANARASVSSLSKAKSCAASCEKLQRTRRALSVTRARWRTLQSSNRCWRTAQPRQHSLQRLWSCQALF